MGIEPGTSESAAVTTTELPPQALIANCTYGLYIANFDFDDLTVAALTALAPPIIIIYYM